LWGPGFAFAGFAGHLRLKPGIWIPASQTKESSLTTLAAPRPVTAVALQSDGKIVVAGEKGGQNTTAARDIVVRLTTDGKLDDTFGRAGLVSIRLGSIDSTTTGHGDSVRWKDRRLRSRNGGRNRFGCSPGHGWQPRYDLRGFIVLFPNRPGPLVIHSDSKMVMAGGAAGDRALLRFTSSGQLDTTFGSGGAAALAFWGNLGLQPDGKFLVAGSGLLARYNPNGHARHDLRDSRTSSDLVQPAAIAPEIS